MKTVEELNKGKAPIVTNDLSSDLFAGKVLFPKKLEKANQMLKTAILPEIKHHLESIRLACVPFVVL